MEFKFGDEVIVTDKASFYYESVGFIVSKCHIYDDSYTVRLKLGTSVSFADRDFLGTSLTKILKKTTKGVRP